MNLFQKTATEIKEEDKNIKRDTFLRDTIKFSGIVIKLYNQRDEKNLTDLVDNIASDEKPINDDNERIFIDESNIFDHDDIIDNDEKLIIDRTNFSLDAKIYNYSDYVKMAVAKNEVNEEVKDRNMDEETEGKKIYRLYNGER